LKRVNQNIELKKNHDLKLKLIEELKDLLHSDDDNKSKYERFLSIRKNWVSIGKVPGHLAFGLNNSYDHQVKVFYDFIYLDKDFKEKDQSNNKRIKEEIIKEASRLEKYADKLKSYRELLIFIRKWNYQIGPVKTQYEEELNSKFDSIIKNIKENKKDYLNNRGKFDEENLKLKKNLINNLQNAIKNLPKDKNSWIKLINQVSKIKEEFINIGPIKIAENNEIWKEFKEINRNFIKEKNLFFKGLKKDYSVNINKQSELINELQVYSENKKLDKKYLIELRNKFKLILNVPFKRNKENWNSFNEIYNKCFEKIDSSKSEESLKEKEILDNQKKLKDDLLKDFSFEKIDLIIEEWKKLGNIKSLKQTNELLSGLEKKLKELELNDVDDKMLEIKSKILNKNTINSEKSKLKKKIDDYTKLIAQLENNLNFIKGDSESDILSNVHSNIKNYKSQIKKLQKNLELISKG